MQPKTVSASSLSNWEDCQRKYHAVNIEFIPEVGDKLAAKTGTAVHYALEHFVRQVHMEGTAVWDDVALLESLYHEGYKETFGSANKRSPEYKDGLALVQKWHERTDLTGWEIDNVEEKKRIPIGSTGVKLTYIFDRVQKKITPDGRRILKVVDYKTERKTYSYEELKDKLQCRIYALAAAVEYFDWKPDEIWVELDMLRFTAVGRVFAREEQLETREMLFETVEMIQATEAKDAQFTLGNGCKFCPITASCKEMQANIAGGGLFSIGDIDAMVLRRHEANAQKGALDTLIKQLDGQIEEHAAESGVGKFKSGELNVSLSQGGTRVLTSTAAAAQIIGPAMMGMYGKIDIGIIDELLKGDSLTDDQKAQLGALITKKPNDKITVRISKPAPRKKKEEAA